MPTDPTEPTSGVDLSETFFARIAGWQAMKQARSLLAQDQVLSSDWSPPILRGVVREGSASYRAGLVIPSERNLENLCTCRASREWGTICAHSVAVGLHHLQRAGASEAGKPGEASAAQPAAEGAARQAKPPAAWVSRVAPGAAGEPAELFVILPPNLEPAVHRGKVMICLEAGWQGSRRPLNALPRSHAYAFPASDAALLDHLEKLAGPEPPAALMLGTRDFKALLPLLAEHPRVTLGRSAPLKVTQTPLRLKLKANLEPAGEIKLALSGALSQPPCVIEGEWGLRYNTLQPLGLPATCRGLFEGPIRLARPQVPAFLIQDWPRLLAEAELEADFSPRDFILEPEPPRFQLHLAGGLARLQARLECRYGLRLLPAGVTAPDESPWLPDPDSPRRYTTRDLAAERAGLGRLLRCGFKGPDASGQCELSGQNEVLNFFAREFPRLEKEWEVTLEERLERSTTQNLERIEPQFQIIPSGVQWFDLGVTFRSRGGEQFSPAEIQRLVLSGQGHRRLRNGKIALIDTGAVEELNEVLLDCAPQQHAGGYRLDNTQAGFLEATLRQQGWQPQAPAAWRQRAWSQSGEAKPDCPPLGELEAVLRPYQKTGVGWLHFLRANGFGGILADEMGLGKTLQTLALIQNRAGVQPPASTGAKPGGDDGSAPARDRRKAGPALVVCPTSLVFNWVAEATRFTPRLEVLALHGPERHSLIPRIPESDLVVTSYALLRRDAERYGHLEFDLVVLDEAQHIKNRQTQNAQAVKSIRARHRLVLTGTPLENSVLDLWSIFDFLMPGYLGAAPDFRERYELPITRDRNAAAQDRLARRLRPFLLRRTKAEVAPELPPKIEQVAWCELTDDQRAVYAQVMEAGRRELLEAGPAPGQARSRMAVLNALLRLRQVCCDLRLLQLENIDPATASGKMDLFGELLEEVLDGGHRALVFSQFVSLLTLLREKLTAEGIEFCYLDGSTPDRATVIEQFQRRPHIPVFLISLKAGGVGLNLTGADTVIHFDPWWNPAVEDQATDRAHRLGQARVVTSYKLITRDTVEEKILALQAHKRQVIQGTLGSEAQLAEALTWEEIQELLG